MKDQVQVEIYCQTYFTNVFFIFNQFYDGMSCRQHHNIAEIIAQTKDPVADEISPQSRVFFWNLFDFCDFIMLLSRFTVDNKMQNKLLDDKET